MGSNGGRSISYCTVYRMRAKFFFFHGIQHLGKKRIKAVGNIGQRIRRGGSGLSVEVVTESIQRVAKSEDNVPGGRLSGLAFFFHLGVVFLGGFLGHIKDLGRIPEHVTGRGLECLGGEGNASVDLVVINDHTLDGHAGLENLFQIFDAVVRDLRNVQETRHATNLDKGSVGLEGLDNTLDEVASGKVGHLCFDDGLSVGDNQFVVLLVNLQEFQGKDLSNELFGGHLSGKVRSGKEGTESLDEADGSSAVDTDNLGFEDGIIGLHLENSLPCRAVLDSSDGDEELSILVFIGDDLEVEFLVEVDEVIDNASDGLDEGGLGFGQIGGGLGTDIHDNTLGFVLDALSLDDGVSFEGVGGLGNGGLKIVVAEGKFLDFTVLDWLLESLVVLLQSIKTSHLGSSGLLLSGSLHGGGVQRRSGSGPRSRREGTSANHK
mmetsp:Transcript_2076/g.4350  ORF Transcript_2076/g.4350 Transcript_2076/m.4350 type:complete len:434 (-) Transcript_2076:134-1435(-)